MLAGESGWCLPARLALTHVDSALPGVRVLAVGLGQADTGELRQAVTGDNTQNIFYVRDAAQLDSLHSGLADALCLIARTQEASEKPWKISSFTFLKCSSF